MKRPGLYARSRWATERVSRRSDATERMSVARTGYPLNMGSSLAMAPVGSPKASKLAGRLGVAWGVGSARGIRPDPRRATGIRRQVTVDLGRGRRFMLNLWSSATHQRAGLQPLAPTVERLVNPLVAEPSQLIGDGDVIDMDVDRTARE